MDPIQNDVSATPPDGIDPSGTDLSSPDGDETSRPDSSSDAASSLNTPSLNVESNPPDKPAGMPRRQFLRGLTASGVTLVAGAMLAGTVTPASATGTTLRPGSPNAWEASQGIYSGVVAFSTGNVTLTIPITSWSGTGGGLSFALVFNSQSTRTSYFGYKWTCSYNYFILGTSPAVVVADDGSETAYTLSGSTYTAPAGCYDTLVHNVSGTWTLTKKSGALLQFITSGNLTSVTDTQGNLVTITGGGANPLVITDPTGRAITLTKLGPDVVQINDSDGNQWHLTYGGANQPAQIALPAIGGTTYSLFLQYDAASNVNQITDMAGKFWKYAYTGTVLSFTTDPTMQNAMLTYPTLVAGAWPANVTGLAKWQDAGGSSVTSGIDTQGRLVAQKDMAGNLTTFGYDSANNRTSLTLPSTKVWQYTYDTKGNNLITQDPLGHQTVNTYDTRGRMLSSTDANNHQTSWVYDGAGNLTLVTDGNLHTTTYTPNANGTIAQITDAENRVTNFGYDTNGNQNSVTVVKDAMTSFVTNFVNDSKGRRTQRTDALSRVTNYTLDAWGRPTTIAYPTTGNTSLGFSYDGFNNILQSTDGTGIRNWTYDVFNNKKTATDPRGNTTATYDNVSNLLTQTDVTGRLLTNVFNTLNQLTKVTDSNDSTHADLVYTIDGLLSTLTYPNDVRVEYGYDGGNRLTSITHRVVSTSAVLIFYTAVYDNGNRITQITESPSGDVTSFGYDNADNLLTETRTGTKPYSGSYTYDKTNRRKTAVVITNGTTTHNGTYTYDGAGRLTQVVDSATSTTEAYTWNVDGTLASSPGSGYTKVFGYDEEGHLTSIGHLVGTTTTTLFQYGYGADGNRRWRKDLAGNVWTWYPCGVACSAGELVEQTSNLTGTTWATSGLYMRAGGGCSSQLIRRNSEYHHIDLLGSYGVITNSTGTVLSSNIYDVLNVQRFTSGSAVSPWRFYSTKVDVEGLLVIGTCYAIPERDLALTQVCQKVDCYDYCSVFPPSLQQDCLLSCLSDLKRSARCNAKCDVKGNGPDCKGKVYGTGIAKTIPLACKAAKKDAGHKVPRGCQAVHCDCINCTDR